MNETSTAQADKVTSKHKYIFPNFMAKMMANVDPKTQYESAMLSSALILAGIIMTSIMMIFFMDLSVMYKVLIGLNCIGGFMYISSSLVTVYQQYANYCDIMEIQKSMMSDQNAPKVDKPKIKKNRVNQAIVGLGLLFVLIGIGLFFTSLEIYYGIALLVAGCAMIIFIIKKGKDIIKKNAIVEKLIREGKLKPKIIPIKNEIKKITPELLKVTSKATPTIEEPKKKKSINLIGRLRGLMAGIKIAKLKKEEEKEKALKMRLQATLDEIKRLKLSERRTQ